MFKERLKGLTGKIESTYLTDATPAIATDGIQIEENIWSEIEIGYLEENLRDDMAQAGLGRAGAAGASGQYGHVTVTVPIKGCTAAFAAANLPEADVLLRAAGMLQTLDVGVGTEFVTYTPRSDSHESATFYAYSSGSRYNLVGCRAQLTEMTWTPAQYIRATFEIWGVVDSIADLTHPTILYPQESLLPPRVTSAAATLNGVTLADFTAYTFEMRTDMATLPRGNAAAGGGGHGGYEITDWNPHLRVVMDKMALATFNPYTLRTNGTRFAWNIGPVGGTQYNQIQLAGASGRMVGHGHSADDGLPMWDLEVRCENTDSETPDDAFTLTFD